jgi:hypothetical protein
LGDNGFSTPNGDVRSLVGMRREIGGQGRAIAASRTAFAFERRAFGGSGVVRANEWPAIPRESRFSLDEASHCGGELSALPIACGSILEPLPLFCRSSRAFVEALRCLDAHGREPRGQKQFADAPHRALPTDRR